MNYSFEAIGTHWSIDIPDEYLLSEDMLQRVNICIESYDRMYSRFRKDSAVWSLSTTSASLALDRNGSELFNLYRTLYNATDGKITPLIGQALAQAGYDDSYTFHEQEIQKIPAWDEIIHIQDSVLTLTKPYLLDTGAAGKGQLIDIVGSMLEEQGISEYTVDAGGDMRYRGTKPLRVGLEDPDNEKKVLGIVHLDNKSICGSSGNRRTWGRFHHILDPETRTSPLHTKAVWVIADDTMTADGLSTSLFFVPPERLTEHFLFEYFILYADYSAQYSKNFPCEVF